MHRREVLSLLGAATLSALLAPLSAQERYDLGERLHARLGQGQAPRALTPAQMATLVALSDTILPATDTPGAVDVGVPAFIDLLLAEWYSDTDTAELLRGLDGIEERCRATGSKGFAESDPAGRGRFLTTIDGIDGAAGSLEAAYRRLKSAIVFGYVTSEPVARLMTVTPIIPGRFDGCIPVGGSQ
ncbi:MAG TPA: gluconate 2-dehydrogenase subunit 3 family protein [Gemmatimonadales bacterium]|nr:gluconate 2-dehydrogenase subunit 3 family protein [Gemmatimonadales bacterium]